MNELATLTMSGDERVPVASLSGEVDMSNADEIARRLIEAVPNDAVGLVIDLSAAAYLDSAAIRVLFDLARRLGNRQQRIQAVVPTKSMVRRVLQLTKLDAVIPFEEDLAVAIAYASGAGVSTGSDGGAASG